MQHERPKRTCKIRVPHYTPAVATVNLPSPSPVSNLPGTNTLSNSNETKENESLQSFLRSFIAPQHQQPDAQDGGGIAVSILVGRDLVTGAMLRSPAVITAEPDAYVGAIPPAADATGAAEGGFVTAPFDDAAFEAAAAAAAAFLASAFSWVARSLRVAVSATPYHHQYMEYGKLTRRDTRDSPLIQY